MRDQNDWCRGKTARSDESCRPLSGPFDSHVDHKRAASGCEMGNRIPMGFPEGLMTGHESDRGGRRSTCQRDSSSGGSSHRGGNAWYHLPRNTSGRQGFGFFRQTREDGRVSTFQPDDRRMPPAQRDEHFTDGSSFADRGRRFSKFTEQVRAGDIRAIGGHLDEARTCPSHRHNAGMDQPVVNHGIGHLQQLGRSEGEQMVVPGAGADKKHRPRGGVRLWTVRSRRTGAFATLTPRFGRRIHSDSLTVHSSKSSVSIRRPVGTPPEPHDSHPAGPRSGTGDSSGQFIDFGAPMSTDPGSQSPIELTASERARAVRCFEVGSQRLGSDIDYAIEMFTQCVLVDPSNAVYLQSLLGALRKKHGGKARGGLTGLWSAGSKAMLQKTARSGNGREVLKQGLGVLKSNPFDHGCLLEMAKAAGQLHFVDAQRAYLKSALDASPADAEVNRQCAAFLAERGEYDQAIACWVRVSKAKGLEEESQREIAKLQVSKTIVAGEGMAGRSTGANRKVSPESVAEDPIAQKRARFDADPANMDAALDLADVLEREVSPEEAEKVLAKALEASGNDLKIREHLEDRQMRWARQRVMVAERRAQAEDTDKNRDTLARLREALLRLEVETYAARVSRYPENLSCKYELAVRLKSLGNYSEAIRHFQDVLQDSRRKGVVSLELGECFQKIKQYQLAMRNFTTAVEVLTDRDMELRKRALYRAGVLAGGMEDIDASLKYLSTLAGLDFGYKDVAQRLDKLNSIRDKQ